MMGMRVSFDIDYSSLWRSGEPGQRFRFPLSHAPDFEDPRIEHGVGSSRTMLPKLPADTWHLRAHDLAAGGMLGRVLAP